MLESERAGRLANSFNKQAGPNGYPDMVMFREVLRSCQPIHTSSRPRCHGLSIFVLGADGPVPRISCSV
jgi:hypothetical protein